jgi:hypothetical protein
MYSYIVNDVVQNGLRSCRHHKDLQAKMEHQGVRRSGAIFSLQSIQEFLCDENISIVETLDIDINTS